eukprot:ctg_372.g239
MSVRESSTTSSSNGSGGGGGDEQRKLFVGGLSWDTDETSLRRHFEQFGSVEQAVIKRDRVTNQPRGFGFVTFADGAAAQRVAAMERHEVDGRRVEAKMAHPRGSDEGGSGASVGTSAGDSSNEADSGVEAGEAPQRGKLFVGGLPGACNDRELRAYFEPYGTVSEAHVMYDHQTGHSRGFGFVTFADEAAAAALAPSYRGQNTSEPQTFGLQPPMVGLYVVLRLRGFPQQQLTDRLHYVALRSVRLFGEPLRCASLARRLRESAAMGFGLDGHAAYALWRASEIQHGEEANASADEKRGAALQGGTDSMSRG